MTTKKASKILREYNTWRKESPIEDFHYSQKELTEALDIAANELNRKREWTRVGI